MKRKSRYLDRKADKQRHPNNVLKAPAQLIERPDRQHLRAELVALGHQHSHVEGMRITAEVESEDCKKHQHAAEERIEKELDRRIFTARSTPDADEKIHRQEHDFPEDVKEKKIQSAEDSHHARIEHEKQREIAFHGFFDAKGGEYAQKTKERCQQHHGDAETIDSHVIADVIGWNPLILLGELKTDLVAIKVGEEPNGHEQRRHGSGGGDPTNELGVIRQPEHQRCPRKRNKGHVTENIIHLLPSLQTSAPVANLDDDSHDHRD